MLLKIQNSLEHLFETKIYFLDNKLVDNFYSHISNKYFNLSYVYLGVSMADFKNNHNGAIENKIVDNFKEKFCTD